MPTIIQICHHIQCCLMWNPISCRYIEYATHAFLHALVCMHVSCHSRRWFQFVVVGFMHMIKVPQPLFLSCFTLTYAGQPHLFDPFSVLLGSSPLLHSYHPSLEHTRIVSIKYVSIVFCREHLPHYWHKHMGYIWILRGAQN